MPLIIPNVNTGIIYDVDLFASKIFTTDSSTKSTAGLHHQYENAHYIISMEQVE